MFRRFATVSFVSSLFFSARCYRLGKDPIPLLGWIPAFVWLGSLSWLFPVEPSRAMEFLELSMKPGQTPPYLDTQDLYGEFLLADAIYRRVGLRFMLESSRCQFHLHWTLCAQGRLCH